MAGIYTAFRKSDVRSDPTGRDGGRCGYFQFVYADGETRTFRYASEEQGLWIGEDERCLVDGQAFYDWQDASDGSGAEVSTGKRGAEMNGKKKRHVILIVLAVVALAAGILGGRELWLYEHPEIQIRFSHDRSEDLYRSYPICSIRSRSHIGQGYAKQYGEELRQYWEATNEVFVWISEQYRKTVICHFGCCPIGAWKDSDLVPGDRHFHDYRGDRGNT